MNTAAAIPASSAVLAADRVTVRAGQRTLVSALSLDVSPGEFIAVLGRNGSGKTLTLHTLAGLRPPAEGEVRLDGVPLSTLSRRAVARRVGLLMQDLEESFTTTALESVLIGRHPHLKLWEWEGAEDERIAREALARVDMDALAQRSTNTLSGGELRRLAIAALLAQQPAVFLLDEPTNHLDPHHQLAVLTMFRELVRQGASVIATLHDPTLAARFADRALLLFDGGRWTSGTTRDVLTSETLSELYVTKILEITSDGRRIFLSA